MRWPLLSVAPLLAVLAGAAHADWLFRSSYYSHDPASGQRVSQYAPPAPAYSRVGAEGYLQSAYRHNETTLRVGDDADHIHVVETWGAGDQLRPYGEWQYPYRAGATPYGPWGNPQGPWTLPFDSWQNPYGLLQHANPPYGRSDLARPNYGQPNYRQPNYGPPNSAQPHDGQPFSPQPNYGQPSAPRGAPGLYGPPVQ